MPNLFDYLEWRGDLTLEQDPFNEIDALILSRLSYAPLDGIVTDSFHPGPDLAEAARLYGAKEDAAELVYMEKDLDLLLAAGQSTRFCGMRLSGYVNSLDHELEKQFAALTVHCGNFIFVSFRGTDDTLVGWKEDFNMSFRSLVPAQTHAVVYLLDCAAALPGAIRVGGHSKGGNLAVYAAAFCGENIQERIIKIYNHDGPGFHEETLATPGYAAVRDKIGTYIPQSSVVGMMLGRKENYLIIRSSQSGLFQHDLYSWEVQRKDFIYLTEVTNESRFVDSTLKTWLNEVSPEQREKFIDGLYEIVSAANARTTSEFTAKWYESAAAGLKSLLNMDEETRKGISMALRQLMKAAWRHVDLITPQIFNK